uniref:Secreted protein n=1 Tax=Arundo donax TaxID=35708 RepID=A0A0A9FNT3_ARUDO
MLLLLMTFFFLSFLCSFPLCLGSSASLIVRSIAYPSVSCSTGSFLVVGRMSELRVLYYRVIHIHPCNLAIQSKITVPELASFCSEEK